MPSVLSWCSLPSAHRKGKLVCAGCFKIYSKSGFHQHLKRCPRACELLPGHLQTRFGYTPRARSHAGYIPQPRSEYNAADAPLGASRLPRTESEPVSPPHGPLLQPQGSEMAVDRPAQITHSSTTEQDDSHSSIDEDTDADSSSTSNDSDSTVGSSSSLDTFSDLDDLGPGASDCESDSSEEQPDENSPRQVPESNAAQIPGQAEWYKQRLGQPLFPGSRISMLAFCYVLLTMKRSHKVKNSFFSELLCLLSQKVFPEQHCAPPTWYLMRKVVGCKDAADCERHVCRNECTSWPPLPQSEWQAHVDDKCSICEEPRFAVVTLPSGLNKLMPQKRYYDFGLSNLIRNHLFTNPDYCQARGQHRNFTETGYHGCADARRIDAMSGDKLSHPNNSGYDLALDWGQLYTFATWSQGLLMLRAADLPPSMRAKQDFSLPLAIIPGKHEPKQLQGYLLATLSEFQRYGPAGSGLQVTQHFREGSNIKTEPLNHVIFLTGVFADAPARQKCALLPSVAAYLGCGLCLFQGVRVGSNMCFKGYRDRVPQDITFRGKRMKADDARLQLSHAQHMERAELVDTGLKLPQDVGCHGLSIIPDMLDYVDYSTIWVLPIAHMLLHGVGRSLWNLLLTKVPQGQEKPAYALSSRVQRLLQARAQEIDVTADFGRRCKCVVKDRGHFTMEDWLHFWDTFTPYLLRGNILPAPFQEMCELLREVIVWYLRANSADPGELQYTTANRLQARQRMWRYAELVEQHLPPSACTANLHWAACHLFRQETARGPISQQNELFLERGIAKMKGDTRHRLTRQPETLYANSVLLDHALAQLQRERPGGVHSFDQLCPSFRSRPLEGPSFDPGDPETGTQLQHKGKPLTRGQRHSAVQAVLQYLVQQQPSPPGFEVVASAASFASAGSLLVHTQILKQGSELITSRQHHRSSSRVSYFVLLQLTPNQQRIAEVLYYLRVRPLTSSPQARPLRLAVCKVFSPKAKRGVMHVADPSALQHEAKAFSADNLVTVLASAHPGRNSSTLRDDNGDKGKIFMLPYGNLSKM